VLVVDDDATVASVVVAYLRDARIESRTAADGDSAERIWREWHPDLVVLDLMLPGRSGLDVLRRLRADGDRTLVVILSARGDEDDRVVGLEFGADDYVVKPFSPRELVLRITGLLRRDVGKHEARDLLPNTIELGPLAVNTAAHEVLLDGKVVALTSREYDLLVFFMARASSPSLGMGFRRQLHGDRAHSAAEGEDRTRPIRSAARAHCARHRVPIRRAIGAVRASHAAGR
jgi:DNA-binding response OmpR family regulator